MAGRYQRKDHLYRKAKAEGARSRAYYKLQELDRKYHLLHSGDFVVDLGAWPGGWLQYISKRVGNQGLAVGIDLAPIKEFSIPNIKVLQGDVRDDICLDAALKLSGRRFDVVLSDLSPKLSGVPEVDQAAATHLASAALAAARRTLRPGGAFTAKVFMSGEAQEFVQEVQAVFNKCSREALQSSRKTSVEFYVVGLGFQAGGEGKE